MAAIDLHYKPHVGTTYKRALKHFHDFRDGVVSGSPTIFALIDAVTKFVLGSIRSTEIVMRKPRDFDSELAALRERERALKAKRVRQLGELVVAAGGDALDIEVLAGSLLAAVATSDTATREAWRADGAAFFQGAGKSRRRARAQPVGAAAGDRQMAPG